MAANSFTLIFNGAIYFSKDFGISAMDFIHENEPFGAYIQVVNVGKEATGTFSVLFNLNNDAGNDNTTAEEYEYEVENLEPGEACLVQMNIAGLMKGMYQMHTNIIVDGFSINYNYHGFEVIWQA